MRAATKRRRTGDREQPDLVRLSLALMGGTRTSEIIDAALDVLGDVGDGSRWAILRSIGAGRYEARCHAGLGQTDLVELGRAATECDPWLVLDRQISQDGIGSAPDFAMYPDDDCDAPALILGRWRSGPRRQPSAAARQRLAMAAELIACASGVARECELLREQSARDMLTGTLNRRGVIDTLDRELSRAIRRGSNVSVLYIDLNGFKAINDHSGHAAGDAVLKRVGEVLAHGLRTSDAIGRIGGDEFLIVLPETDGDVAERIGRRLRRAVRDASITIGAETFTTGMTYGTASLDEHPEAARLIDLADRRMLERKKHRRTADPDLPLSAPPVSITAPDESYAAPRPDRQTRLS